ncbi:TolB family protein [Arenimonas terrae]|uniref:TolB family protein n=1 Tax=Arenimonas terrae TaxID=2546226 RepID=UPI001C707027|nr:hypothetical protein [Arenimonas terrae]
MAFVRMLPDTEGSAVFIQTASPLTARPLTGIRRGRSDLMPMWSPDGRQIAFLRMDEAGCRVLLVPVAGGNEREVGKCLDGQMHMIAWMPDGKALVGVGRPTAIGGANAGQDAGSALHVMSLDVGRWMPLDYERAPADLDSEPAVSPDGRWIAFHRNTALGDIWRVPAGGGTPERLTHLRSNFFGLAWLPDSRTLVLSREAGGRKVLSRLDAETGLIEDYPLHGSNFEYPSTAFVSGAVAFQVEDGRTSMRRLSLSKGEEAYAAAAMVHESTRSNRLPSISPDGGQLMFVSDRTGSPRLWWAERGNADSLRPLEDFTPNQRFAPAWQPSSERVLVTGRGPEGDGLYEIEPRSGRIVRLPVPEGEPTYAAYHPNQDRILVVVTRGGGRLGLMLYDRTTQPWRLLGQVDDDVAVAVADPLGARILLMLRSKQEIWEADLDLGNLAQVDRLRQRGNGRLKSLVATSDGVWLLDSQEGCTWYWRPVARRADGEAGVQRGTCAGATAPMHVDGVAFDPVGRELYVTTIEYSAHDIGYLSAENIAKERALYRVTND